MALTSVTKDFVVKSGLLVEGTGTVTSSTGASSTLQVNGGAAIAKNLVVGTTATIYGPASILGTLNVTGTSTLGIVTATSVGISGTLLVNSTSTLNANLIVNSGLTDTANTSNNAIYVAGGGGIGVSGTLKVFGNSDFSGTVTIDNTTDAGSLGTGALVLSQGGISVNNQARIGGGLTVGGITSISTTTLATTGGAGALVVTGGEYIGGNLIVASTASNTATNSANALYVEGGAWIDKNFTVGGPTTFRDTVTFNGTATYVLSTNSYYTDNIIELHVPPGGVNSPWTVDDGKDIGIRIHYYSSGADQNAALVLADDSKYLEWYGTGAESNTGVFTSATYGTFKTGNILLAGSGDSSSTITGSLQLVGGAGIGKNLYVGAGVNASTLTARSLATATNNLVYADTNGQLQITSVSFNGGVISGTITYANTSTNLSGGATGSLPYQSSTGTTVMLPIGANTQVLTVSGGVPVWASASGTTVGNASYSVTATNIAGGLANQIPYQQAPNTTIFSNGLTFNGTTFTATNAVINSGNNATSSTGYSGALMVQGGVGISKDLWVGGNVNIGGTLFFNGVGADQVTSNTGTFVDIVITGTGVALTVTNSVFIGQNLQVGNILTATDIVVTGANVASSTITGALQVVGGTGIGGALYVGGNTVLGANSLNSVHVYGAGTGGSPVLRPEGEGGVGFIIGSGGTGPIVFNTGTSASLGNQTVVALTSGGTNYVTLAGATSGNGPTISVAGGDTNVNINLAPKGAGSVIIPSTVASTSTNTGALQVAGGLGVGGSINAGSYITVANGVYSSNTFTGSYSDGIIVDYNPGAGSTGTGRISVGANDVISLYNGGLSGTLIATFSTGTNLLTSTVQSASTNTGALVVNGGVGIGGNLNVGGSSTLNSLTATTFTATSSNIIGNETVGGLFTVTNTTDSSLTTNGSIVTAGGVGVAKAMTVGGTITIGSSISSSTVAAIFSNNSLYSSFTSNIISTNTKQNLDSYASGTYRTAKYVVQIVDTTGNKVHIEEILVFHDGTYVYMSEYGITTNTGELGTFDATIGGGLITLNFTPNYTPGAMTIKVVRTAITA